MKPVKSVAERLPRTRAISWETITLGVLKAVREIGNSWIDFDLVIGVGRAGAIIGAMVAGNLGHKPFYAIDRAYPVNRGIRGTEIKDYSNMDVEGLSVSVVFSEVVRGGTVEKVKEYFKAKNPKILQTLAFKSDISKNVDVDYVVFTFRYEDSSLPQP